MIKDFKDFEKFLKICRRQGVFEATLGDLTIKLGDLPAEHKGSVETSDGTDPYADFPQGELTPEQLAFYSAGGLPKDDPFINQ